MGQILSRHLSVRGFIQHDFISLYPQFLREMGAWLREKKIRWREDIVDGLENAPSALIGLLQGKNFGKLIVRL